MTEREHAPLTADDLPWIKDYDDAEDEGHNETEETEARQVIDDADQDAEGKNKAEDKRKANVLLRKLDGKATTGDEQTWSEGEFARAWARVHSLEEFLFVKGMGWLTFDSGIWREGAGAAHRAMVTLVKERVAQTKAAPRFDRYNAIEGALKMAEVEPDENRTVELDSFDKNPMTIGLPDGQLFDIEEGAARPATPGDRIRKALAFMPAPEPSRRWANFVYQSLAHYKEEDRDRVAAWLQEFCGAMLSGNCSDQKCLFIWGSDGTGKGVFAETLRHVAGQYGAVLAGDRIAGREQGHRQWVVGLQGRRLVLINELPERARWHTADLNALIEGGPLEGNSMRRDSINFDSQASVVIVGNHRPRASAASGIWRRLVQIEFRNKPATPDTKLLDKLKAEADGVLAWMLEGAARWHERGQLPETPEPIRQAVEAYRREADPMAQYLAERTIKEPDHIIGVDDLYADFRTWWLREVDNDEKQVPKKRGFGAKLNEAGWAESVSVNGRRVRTGYSLVDSIKPEIKQFPYVLTEDPCVLPKNSQ